MIPRAHIILLTISCLVIVACSTAEDSNPTHRFSVLEENGVLVAENNGIPKYEGELFQYEILFQLKEDEREASILGRPSIARIDEELNIYVLDRSDRRIAVFSPDGVYKYDIGRQGDGPGEFQDITIQKVNNGILEVYDGRSRRVTMFSTSGELLDIITLPSSTMVRITGCYPLSDDRVITISTNANLREERESRWAEIKSFNSTGEELWSIQSDIIPGGRMIEFQSGNRMIRSSAPFPFRSYPSAFFSDRIGILVASSDDPNLEVYDTSGNITRIIRLGLVPQPVTQTDKNLFEANLSKRIDEASDSQRAMLESQLRSVEYPAVKAYWEWMEIDAAGYIWLRYNQALADGEVAGGVRFRLISPAGEYLGDTLRPLRSLRADRGIMIAIEEDPDTGAQTVVGYRMISIIKGLSYP